MKRANSLVTAGLILLTGVWAFAAAAKPAPKAKSAGNAKPTRPVKRPRKPSPVMAPIKDVAGLPRVLLIGDSISIGYTLPARKLLAGKVNLHRIPTNGGPTSRGLAELDTWLGKGKWDAIHFNWGLHDLKFISGKEQVPPEQYGKNLRELVKRLKKTGAKLIWTSTTPVPEGSGSRKAGDAAKYNKIAAKIMAEAKIPTDDLYAFCMPRLKKIQRPKNVHFLPEGSAALAHQAANSILKALGKPLLPKPKPKPAAPKPKAGTK